MSTRSEIPLHPVNDPMEMAFSLASEALKAGEVPVGCVFVYRGAVIASGRNEVTLTEGVTPHFVPVNLTGECPEECRKTCRNCCHPKSRTLVYA